MFDPIIILMALICGAIARALGLPALIGYLGAGFALHEMHIGGGQILHYLANIGITLMLFSIGLKLRPQQLLLLAHLRSDQSTQLGPRPRAREPATRLDPPWHPPQM